MTKTVNLFSKPQKGFGLLEVLITVVILSIGLLGLAGLQATGLSFNQSAYQRSQATIMAYDIIDRMRVNPAAIDSYRTAIAAPTDGCTLTAGCTPVQMAQNDILEWNTSLISVFGPLASGTITFATPIYTVDITWDENRDGDNTNDPNFLVSFQP